MARKDREKKKELKEDTPNQQNIARKEAKMAEQKLQEKRINSGRTLMMMGLGMLFLATVILILADILQHDFTNQFKMFAYGLTVAAGIALLASRRFVAANSRTWLLIAGIAAVFLGLIAFIGYSFGVLM